MKVSEVAKRAGTSASAIRFYEKEGVLPPAPRRRNGYRDYGDADLARVRLLVALRRLGLDPADAGRLARVCVERGSMNTDLASLIARQRAAISAQRDELDLLEVELIDLEETLAAAGRRKGGAAMPDRPIRVLFVCTGNAARSQMAEALLGRLGGDAFHVRSAGTEPRGVDPDTNRTLAESGIDWSRARSKSVSEFIDEPWDYVITVCDRARQTCPVFPGVHESFHWGLDDPALVTGVDGERLAAFRRTIMELTVRLRPFIEVARRSGTEDASA